MLTKVKLLNDKAVMPVRAHDSDSGYDIKMTGIKKIEGDVVFFETGISVEPPKGHYFQIVPRSSISKLPLSLANSVGIIDEHYRGEILIPVRVIHPEGGAGYSSMQTYASGLVKMFGSKPGSITAAANLILAKKPVLFQMILKKRLSSEFEEVQDLSDTVRGDGGFGSTD